MQIIFDTQVKIALIGAVFIWVSYLSVSRHFFIQSEVNQTNRNSLAVVFLRFASTTCNYFEFWLAHWTACVLLSINQSINQSKTLFYFEFSDSKNMLIIEN